MDSKIICMALFLVVSFSQIESRSIQEHEQSMLAMHEQWIWHHGRVYENDIERLERFNIFKDNIAYIEAFNAAGDKPYKLAINKFSELTKDEFNMRNGLLRSRVFESKVIGSSFMYENASSIPTAMDWRTKGAVTPVKNQGGCASCWAFSAVAAMEGITKIRKGELIPLSEQELIDCDVNEINQGCNNGNMILAFEFIVKDGGLTTESNYPYQESDSNACNQTLATNNAATITGLGKVPPNNESALLLAVAHQPVSVGIDANSNDFQFYAGGVYTGKDCGTNLNHAVTIVGYGVTEDGTKYWLVKNSYGTGWGEAGYIRMARDVEAVGGVCGIAMDASYPIA